MATMDKASRIVRCPKCLALLQEPPPGTPLYKCGNCSTVLRAKHAASDGPGARRGSTRAQQPNRATLPAHADSIEGRKLLPKPMPLDLTSRQANLDDSDDYRNRTGNPRFSPADIGKTSPGHMHHGNIPPGPTPPTHVRSMTNTYAENGSRTVQDHQRLVPRDSLASPSREDDLLRRREALTYVLQTRGSSPAYVEEARSGKKSPNNMVHNIRSPLTDQIRNPSAISDARDEKEGFIDVRTRNTPANVTNEGANNGVRERQRTPGAEDDGTTFSPTNALNALRMQNAGPLYKVKERQQVPGQGATSKFSIRNSQGSLIRGRNRSQGDESTGTGNADFGLRHDAVEPGPSTVRNREEMLGLHRRQRSDGAAFSERSPENDIYGGSPALNSGTRWSLEEEVKAVDKFLAETTHVLYVSEKERRALHSLKLSAGKEKSRDNPVSARGDEEKATPDQKSISRTSPSDIARQLNERRTGSPPKTNTNEQELSPASDVSLVRRIPPELKALQNEKVIVSKDTLDDGDKPGALLKQQGYSPSLSPGTRGKPMSPPRFLLTNLVIEGAQSQPEHMSKVQELDSPSSLQVFHDLPDVLDYDTCEDSSNADDADQYQVMSKPHSEELKSPPYPHNGQVVQADVTGGSNGRLDDEDEQVPTDTMSMNSRSQPKLGVVSFTGPVKAGASSDISSHRSPEPVHSKSAPQTQISDQRKQELQGTSTRPPDVLEAANSFSFGLGGLMQGQGYSSLKGQTQKVRLQINTAVPERIHVRCRHCKLQLEVPPNLARSETGVQKLRCGSCWKTSRFRLNHLLSLSESSSPAGSDRSPESSFRLGSSDGTSGRYSGTRSNRETGSQDRTVIRTQSGANLPVPPSARHNPRAASGSKLSNMVSVSGVLSETSKASTPATSGDLDPAASSSPHGGKDLIVAVSPSGQGEPSHTSLSPTLSSTSQEVNSKDRQQKITSPDRRLLQSSSDSDEEKASSQLKIGPSAFVPTRMATWSAPETPDFDDGHEFKGLKGFLKKSVKELTKGKKSTQFRRKVVVNGHVVPDDVVRRAEEHAGGIHPGSYWYDFRAGFWGVMGGPCLGMIPPFIEEFNFPLARHCSHGKTGVSVNGRELHHKDLELLKKRGLPGTPGKSYNVDIDGRLTEETTGFEFKGLGRLAPTLEQTGRGPGMWVPESQRGS